jgi:hypothetical protein
VASPCTVLLNRVGVRTPPRHCRSVTPDGVRTVLDKTVRAFTVLPTMWRSHPASRWHGPQRACRRIPRSAGARCRYRAQICPLRRAAKRDGARAYVEVDVLSRRTPPPGSLTADAPNRELGARLAIFQTGSRALGTYALYWRLSLFAQASTSCRSHSRQRPLERRTTGRGISG